MKLIYGLLVVSIFFNLGTCSADELDEFSDEMAVEEVYDPLSGYNRAMTSFNDVLYENVMKPVASGYANVVHTEIRESISKFFHNLYFPMRLTNNLLQGKFKNSLEESERFVLNSTVGILGFFDPAKSKFEIDKHNEDFGQTLGFYGVGAGPHVVLPLFGPSNVRDTISMIPDSLLSPIDYVARKDDITILEYVAIKTVEKVNCTSQNIEKYEKLKADAIDLYPYQRDVYEQYRQEQIEE
ncbi:VacJ family lipoprotein [Sulfurimonas sp.]|nr:VacJ family lipoprotein [Sulfurimonas sp.]